MTEYLCLDCGGMGEGPAFLEPSDDMYQGESSIAAKFAKKGEMTYVGCPDCGSPNVFFDAVPKSTEPEEEEEDDEDLELEPTSPPVKKKKKKRKKKSKTKAKQFELAPDSKKTRSSSASMSDGDNVTRETFVAKEVPAHAVQASDQPDVICVRSKEKVVRRRKYKRKCKDCRQRFETKHRDVHYCLDCLGGLSRGR